MRSKKRIQELRTELHSKLSSYGESWVPKYNRFVGAPPLMPYEALSSWCWRIASQCRIPINAVLKAWGVGVPSYCMDDGTVFPNWRKVAISTGTQLQKLESLMFCHSFLLRDPEFSCLTYDLISRMPIYRYCVRCLATDSIPFIRKSWRYAFSFYCLKHGCLLRQSCPRCGIHVDLSLRTNKMRPRSSPYGGIRWCGNCGSDLCDISAKRVPRSAHYSILLYQEEMMQLMINSQPNFLPGYGFGITDVFPCIDFVQDDIQFEEPVRKWASQPLKEHPAKNVKATAIPILLDLKRSLREKLGKMHHVFWTTKFIDSETLT